MRSSGVRVWSLRIQILGGVVMGFILFVSPSDSQSSSMENQNDSKAHWLLLGIG